MAEPPAPHSIEVNLRDIHQFFNSMDPSPFHEKDLDSDAEEFIVSWAQEYPQQDPITLVVHLSQFPEGQDPEHLIRQAVHHYFGYRAKLNTLELRRLLKQGRLSLAIGIVFLTTCLLAGEFLARKFAGALGTLFREGLAIAGWVAMWRPMEIYLYDWWPLYRKGKVYEKLSRMHVHVRAKGVRQPG